MNKNTIKAKIKVLHSKKSGEVITDLLTLHSQLHGVDMVTLQYIKNLVGILKKRYKGELEDMPVEECVVQKTLEQRNRRV